MLKTPQFFCINHHIFPSWFIFEKDLPNKLKLTKLWPNRQSYFGIFKCEWRLSLTTVTRWQASAPSFDDNLLNGDDDIQSCPSLGLFWFGESVKMQNSLKDTKIFLKKCQKYQCLFCQQNLNIISQKQACSEVRKWKCQFKISKSTRS